MNSRAIEMQDEPVEMQDAEERDTDVIVDDYKDLEIETLASSRKRFLQWDGLDG